MPHDDGRGILSTHLSPHGGVLDDGACRREMPVDGDQAGSRNDPLAGDTPELILQRAAELPLDLVARRELRMPALRRVDAIAAAIPGKKRLPEPRARADERDGAVGDRLSLLDGLDVLRPEQGEPVTDGVEVVDDGGMGDADRRSQLALVDGPRQVGRPGHAVDHAAGDREAGPLE